ncbi:hypothetical protein SAMN04487970_106224 [Paenibacillus tianmuensis]|uniref:DUF6896 domain-containing protein n=1 Tax=Paenibacillus tianmuensis TaxID=624147 RepID=A0A1G4TQT9_9BACL|nr:hypothetical protein [Paenibacillus tianmuensis]SCW83746.1 hypothetical protein SAMN04487970_106224 [Paenibacillus tianmuensis]
MNEELEILLKQYINDVNAVCALMLNGLGLSSKEELRTFRAKCPSGEFYLDGMNYYTFHGRGCRFSNKDIEIDWDFGFGDKWCGINPMLFYSYIRDNNKSTVPYRAITIINECEDMEQKGKMIKKYDLYYLLPV